MVASAGGIRAGAAYVEIAGDDRPLTDALARSQARLRQWVAENSGGPTLTRATEAAALGAGEERGGFFGGSFRSAELLSTGLRVGVAVAAVRVAMRDVQGLASLFRGDMEGARKAAFDMPFGLGDIAKSLAPVFDETARWIVFWRKGIEDVRTRTTSRDMMPAVEQWNRYLAGVHAAQQALDRATMTAREYARHEVAGMNLAAGEAEKLLALKLRLIEVNEKQQAGAKARAERERGQGLINEAMDAAAKATMSEREYLAYEVRHLGLAADQAEQLLSWKLALLDITERQKEAEAAARAEAEAAIEAYQSAIDHLGEMIQEGERRVEEGRRLTESVQTPRERAGAAVEEAKALLESGAITRETYDRAVRKAVEDAAAAMPDAVRHTIGVRGTFAAAEAAGLAAGGPTDRMVKAAEETARNTKAIALAAELGVVFTP